MFVVSQDRVAVKGQLCWVIVDVSDRSSEATVRISPVFDLTVAQYGNADRCWEVAGREQGEWQSTGLAAQ